MDIMEAFKKDRVIGILFQIIATGFSARDSDISDITSCLDEDARHLFYEAAAVVTTQQITGRVTPPKLGLSTSASRGTFKIPAKLYFKLGQSVAIMQHKFAKIKTSTLSWLVTAEKQPESTWFVSKTVCRYLWELKQ